MTGIVFEGGTFRPIFSCGVMDALLSENILLPYCIGVSAGIADGVSYISKQPQRNLEIMQKYRNDKRYMSRSNWKKNKSIFGLDFVFGEIPDHLIPFDWDTFRSYKGTCLVGVTNAKTGQPAGCPTCFFAAGNGRKLPQSKPDGFASSLGEGASGAPGAHSTASEMSLPSSSTSTTSIMGRMKRAPFFRAKWEPSRLPRMLLMAQGMPMWNTTRPFIR